MRISGIYQEKYKLKAFYHSFLAKMVKKLHYAKDIITHVNSNDLIRKHMNYPERIERVIGYIGRNIDEPLTLEQLSEVACFSKYHFHRLFTAYTGISLQYYIRWLRLKRAAHQLVLNKDTSIIDIAMNAGFESHEAFTRIFKQSCGLSPSKFRVKPAWHAWERAPYSLSTPGVIKMNVTIKNIPAKRLAVIEHRGAPALLGESVNKLIDWSKSQTINVIPKAGESFGIAYDDPNNTNPEEFRFDLGVTIPEQLSLKGGVIEKWLPAGRYAVTVHKGSREHIGQTVYSLYRDWLPTSGEELGELPCIFCYLNFDNEVAETEQLTECWLLLK